MSKEIKQHPKEQSPISPPLTWLESLLTLLQRISPPNQPKSPQPKPTSQNHQS